MTYALCQCKECGKYLTRDRSPDDHVGQCEECAPGHGYPLAKLRGTLTDPLRLELLSLLSEEGAEIIQRKEKIVRWGLDADFQGTTQTHKLESELGDLLAAIDLADYNGLVSYERILLRKREKMRKFREDAAGPRQRLLHARVPEEE